MESKIIPYALIVRADSRTTTYSPNFGEIWSICLLTETPFFVARSTEDYHSMFIALYLVPSLWRAFLSKSPTNQRAEKSTFVY
ncbi:hypothetical protein F4813DRAFT_342609, partial [Daldinia decipiens]|uniref:uncharacterized protein n=1 Tax=Daldinia decipiens TaxID=326647 RepID=UPI0020C2EF84